MSTKSYYLRFTEKQSKQSFSVIFSTSCVSGFLDVFKKRLGENYTIDLFHVLTEETIYVVHPLCEDHGLTFREVTDNAQSFQSAKVNTLL